MKAMIRRAKSKTTKAMLQWRAELPIRQAQDLRPAGRALMPPSVPIRVIRGKIPTAWIFVCLVISPALATIGVPSRLFAVTYFCVFRAFRPFGSALGDLSLSNSRGHSGLKNEARTANRTGFASTLRLTSTHSAVRRS